MSINKKLVGAASVVSLMGAGGIASSALAASSGSTSSGPMSSMVQKIADKFHLNKDDVQKVFDEDRSTREVEREQRFSAKLDQLVTDGKITAEQKQKIVTKFAELKKEREANRDEKKQENQTEREARKTALEQWAKDNGIDLSLIMPIGGHGGPGGPSPDAQ